MPGNQPRIMHFAIQEPIECRKKILESTIEIVRSLKNYERLKQIKKEKIIYKNHLKKNIKEIKTLLTELNYLPRVTYEKKQPKPAVEQKARIQKKDKKTKVKKQAKEKVKKAPSKIDKLNKDIAALKKRIHSL